MLVLAPSHGITVADLDTVTLDWAYYNPVSLVLKQEGWLEQALEEDGIDVRWVQSLGSNKALEFLNAGSLDFGSTAGAAALTHDGAANFIVQQHSDDFLAMGLLVNDIGAYSGTVPIGAGPSVVTVMADGGWTIAVQ